MSRRRFVLALGLILVVSPRPVRADMFGPNEPSLQIDAGGHTAPITRALFAADGRQLITVSRDKTVRFWDVGTRQMLRTLRPPVGPALEGELLAADLSPDGKVLAVAGFGYVRPGKGFNRYSPVFLIDVEGGEIVRTLPGHAAAIRALAFSADGTRLASGGDTDALIKVWDVAAGKVLQVLKGHAGPVGCLAFAPDGKRLLSAGPAEHDGALLWTLEKATPVRLKGPHRAPVGQAAWSPDGSRIATAAAAPGENFFVVWGGGKQPKTAEFAPKKVEFTAYPLLCQSLQFTADGKVLYSGMDAWRSNVLKVDPKSAKVVTSYVEDNHFEKEVIPSGPAALSRDGRLVAVAADRRLHAHLYDAVSGDKLRVLGPPRLPPSMVCWVRDKDPRSRTVAWRTTTIPKDWEYDQPFPDHFFHRAFDLANLRPVAVPEGKDVHYRIHQWSVPGRHLEWKEATKLQLVRNKKPTDVWLETDTGRIVMNSVTFAGPERAVFATDSGLMHAFDLSDAGKGKWLGYLAGFNGSIDTTAPSPDNRYLLAAGEDQVLHVWNLGLTRKDDPTRVRPRPLLSVFVAPPPPGATGRGRLAPEWIAWTPEGYYAASAGGERLMGWQLNNGPGRMATFHPASRFRERFYRPDVVGRLLAEGSLATALLAAEKAGGRKAGDSAVHDVANVLPPTVEVTVSPPKAGRVEINATARPSGDEPVAALELLVDERPWSGPDAVKPLAGRPFAATWAVGLPPGPHTVRVLARTASSLGTSRGAVCELAPAAEKPRPVLYVLAVGVNDYPAGLKLRYAVNDATELEAVLKKYSSPLFRQVEARVVLDADATKTGVLDGLDWLKQKMTPGDVAVFFFAGHGARDRKTGEYYLLPRDVNPADLLKTGVSRPEIKQRVRGIPGRVLVILDACHAGAIGFLFDDLSRELTDEDCGVVTVCAARPSQAGLEMRGHGLLTLSVIEALSGKAATRGGRVYLHHLQEYVIDHVMDLSDSRQHPVVVVPPWMGPFELSKP